MYVYSNNIKAFQNSDNVFAYAAFHMLLIFVNKKKTTKKPRITEVYEDGHRVFRQDEDWRQANN